MSNTENISLLDKTINFLANNKKKIIAVILIIILLVFSKLTFDYFNEKKQFAISNQFNNAKILLSQNKNDEALNLFRNIISSKNKFYSALSLNYIISNNLIENQETVIELFDIALSLKSLDKEEKNLVMYKKGIYLFSQKQDEIALQVMNQIINDNTIWKKLAALTVLNYYSVLGEEQKAEEYNNIIKSE